MKMKFKHIMLFVLGIFLSATTLAQDKLAVAEPVGKGGVSAADIEAFWGILESSIHSEQYKLISRGALKQILTEIGMTTSSGLLDLNTEKKAKLGKIKAVNYILVSEIGMFGTRLNCTLRIIEASTGEIDQKRTANLRVANLDELADKIEPTLDRLLDDLKQSPATAILYPIVLVGNAPFFLAEDFNIHLENALLNQGVQVQNLKSVREILRKNNLGRLGEMEPIMYAKVGKLLEVKTLLQARLTRYEIVAQQIHVQETGYRAILYTASLEGSIRVISAQNGNVLASIPFEERLQFRSPTAVAPTIFDDYGKALVKSVIYQRLAPELMKSKELKGM